MTAKASVEAAYDSALQHAINADKLAQDDPAHAAGELAKAMQALIKAHKAQLQAIEDGINILLNAKRPG
jgi:hypothetical protein